MFGEGGGERLVHEEAAGGHAYLTGVAELAGRRLPGRQFDFASSKISTGEWPPSSSETGLGCSAHKAISNRPTRTEPVSVALRMTGERIRRRLIISGSPVTTFTAPGGTPASGRLGR